MCPIIPYVFLQTINYVFKPFIGYGTSNILGRLITIFLHLNHHSMMNQKGSTVFAYYFLSSFQDKFDFFKTFFSKYIFTTSAWMYRGWIYSLYHIEIGCDISTNYFAITYDDRLIYINYWIAMCIRCSKTAKVPWPMTSVW